jgi:maleylpyruvate isomerase
MPDPVSEQTVSRHNLSATVPWMRQGQRYFLAQLAMLTDDDLQGPSRLAGWNRSHLVGHVARNAEALARLAVWARTGVETPMYADREQRAAEIETSARQPATLLRADAASSADLLEHALDALDARTWPAIIRSAMGREIPATEIPWMRVREVWLHAVDLDAGGQLADLPPAVIDTLLDDVVAVLSAKPNCPAVALRATDRGLRWRLGDSYAESVTIVQAPAADLAGWVTGRLPGSVLRSPTPELPRWL